jgi:hypothetical protein
MAWIDIDGSKFNTDNLTAVRPVDGDDEQCVVFAVGQSAVDGGFLIDMPLDEVFSIIQSARLMEIAGMMNDADNESNESESELEPDDGSLAAQSPPDDE